MMHLIPNRNRKRYAAMLAALALCAMLAGCAADGGATTDNSAMTAAGRTTSETQADAAQPADAAPQAAEEPQTAETPESTADTTGQTTASFSAADVPVFVPNDSGLTQYTVPGETADGAALVACMAENGAFPSDVTLLALDEADGTVRLQFSAALQTHLDASPSAAVLEAVSKTFRAFYEAGGKSIQTLEIYADGAPVTVDGVAIDCTTLMYGELPVSAVVETP